MSPPQSARLPGDYINSPTLTINAPWAQAITCIKRSASIIKSADDVFATSASTQQERSFRLELQERQLPPTVPALRRPEG